MMSEYVVAYIGFAISVVFCIGVVVGLAASSIIGWFL